MKIESAKIRGAAKGEPCTLQIVGTCNGREETTVFAHLPDESNGMAIKPDDLSGCFACSDCHDFIDSRGSQRLPDWEREAYMRRAQTRTLRRLFELGILTIKGVN